MSCDPVQVTGFVDGALPPSERSQVEAHLEICPSCRGQAEQERTRADEESDRIARRSASAF